MPEDVTVEDVEQLHIDAWQLGIKAVAIYRDNCKVGPAARRWPRRTAPTARRRRAAGRHRGRREDRREGRRRSRSARSCPAPAAAAPSSSGWPTARASCTVGEYDDGRPGEIFLRVSKQGSTLAGIMDAFAISVSYGLQYGVPLRSLRRGVHQHALRAGRHDRRSRHPHRHLAARLHLPPPGGRLPVATRSGPSSASSPSRERTQPTLPGVEETVIETRQGSDIPADPKSIPSASELAASMEDDGAAAQPSLLDRAGVTDAAPARPTPQVTPGAARRRPVLHAVRRPDDAGRLLPRLPQLRQHQRLQLTASTTRPPPAGDGGRFRATTPASSGTWSPHSG